MMHIMDVAAGTQCNQNHINPTPPLITALIMYIIYTLECTQLHAMMKYIHMHASTHACANTHTLTSIQYI